MPRQRGTVSVRTAEMPTIFEQDGYRFFFYSNDHEPIHVHVRRGDGEAVFTVADEVALRESSGLKVQELARAQQLAEQNKRLIVERWYEHLT
jgi:hypothetical protein